MVRKIRYKDDRFVNAHDRGRSLAHNIYDDFNPDKTPVFTEVQNILNNFIITPNIEVRKNRGSDLSFKTFVGMNNDKEIRSLIISPFKGYGYWYNIINKNYNELRSIRFKKYNGEKIYVDSSINILYWESEGLNLVLEPKEEVVIALINAHKWSDPDIIMKILKLKRYAFFNLIPYIEQIIESLYSFYGRRIVREGDQFITEIGYGKELKEVIEKMNLSIIENTGSFIKTIKMLDAYIFKMLFYTYLYYIYDFFDDKINPVRRIKDIEDSMSKFGFDRVAKQIGKNKYSKEYLESKMEELLNDSNKILASLK